MKTILYLFLATGVLSALACGLMLLANYQGYLVKKNVYNTYLLILILSGFGLLICSFILFFRTLP